MNKILPLAKPPIITYQHHIYILSILLNYPECYSWFYSNYIQLQVIPNEICWFNFISLFYEDNPALYLETLNKETLVNNNVDVVSYITNAVNNGYYIETTVNEYYISGREAYKSFRLMHDILVYGYDESIQKLHIYGYGAQAQLVESTVTFDDFRQAFLDTGKNQRINMVKKAENYRYQFDLIWVAKQIKDFLRSRNTYNDLRIYGNPPTERVFGLETYRYLIQYYQKNNGTLDIRPALLLDHKKCMLQRLKYLYNNNYLSQLYPIYSEYELILKCAKIIKNLTLKYMLSNTDSILIEIIKQLRDMAKMEKVTLTNLLNRLLSQIVI
jgi:hypothetical protein